MTPGVLGVLMQHAYTYLPICLPEMERKADRNERRRHEKLGDRKGTGRQAWIKGGGTYHPSVRGLNLGNLKFNILKEL